MTYYLIWSEGTTRESLLYELLLGALGDAAHPMTPGFVLATRRQLPSPPSLATGHWPFPAQAVSRW